MNLLSINKLTLAFVYHIPFWNTNGQIWSAHPAIGRYVDSLAPHFSEIILVAPGPNHNDKRMYPLRADNLKLCELPPFLNIQQYWSNSFRYYKKLFDAAHEWDIAHIRMPTQIGFPAYLAAKKNKKPVFLVIVGEGLTYRKLDNFPPIKQRVANTEAWLQDILMRLMVNKCLTFTNGKDLLKKFSNIGKRVYLMRSSTISKSDISSPDRDTCQKEPFKLLTVATISPRKGTSLIPKIISTLNERGIKVQWSYVGKVEGRIGEQEYLLTQEISTKLSVSEQLFFTGLLSWDELQFHYKISDIFVLPTYMEGIPRVILEAQSTGIPLISTEVGGIPQAIQDEYDGLLVPPGQETAFADAIQRIIEDQTFRKQLIKNGIKTAHLHTIEIETQQMLTRVQSTFHIPLSIT